MRRTKFIEFIQYFYTRKINSANLVSQTFLQHHRSFLCSTSIIGIVAIYTSMSLLIVIEPLYICIDFSRFSALNLNY